MLSKLLQVIKILISKLVILVSKNSDCDIKFPNNVLYLILIFFNIVCFIINKLHFHKTRGMNNSLLLF